MTVETTSTLLGGAFAEEVAAGTSTRTGCSAAASGHRVSPSRPDLDKV